MTSVACSAAWQTIKKYIESERHDFIEMLIEKDDDVMRGKIKMIDDLLYKYSQNHEDN